MENEHDDGMADMFDEAAAPWERARDGNEEAVAEYKKAITKAFAAPAEIFPDLNE